MPPTLTAILTLLAITCCYAATCAASPFRTCRRCGGLGFHLRHTHAGTLKRGKECHHCRGAGLRIRAGRWLYNRAARTHHRATHD